jgi:hypothetical protein
MKIDLDPNEVVLRASSSKHYESSTTRKGKLILTNQRIFFVPEDGTISLKYPIIYPNQISELHHFNTLLLIPNGINLITRDGAHNRFSVKQRESWTQLINRMY